MDWSTIIIAALGSGVLSALIGYFTNRQKNRVDAAASNVDVAIRLRDEAMEDRRAAEIAREQAEHVRVEAELARDAANDTLRNALEKLQYLEAQGVIELRTELNSALERIRTLEEEVKQLQGELRASKMRESHLRTRLNRIRGELDTGPLPGGGDAGKG